jgi:hypothetical protein
MALIATRNLNYEFAIKEYNRKGKQTLQWQLKEAIKYEKKRADVKQMWIKEQQS